MKMKDYTVEELQRRISELKRLQNTRLARIADKRYIRLYEQQLEEKMKSSNGKEESAN